MSARVLVAVRNPSLRAFLVLLAILNVAFCSSLWGDRTLLASARDVASVLPRGAFGEDEPKELRRAPDPGAAGWILEPAAAFYHEQLWTEGHLPLWNPHMAYGAPAAANMQAPPFYPLTFLLSLYPTPGSFDWFLIGRLLVAGFSCYLFLRFFLGQGPSLLGGTAFMLSGYLILYLHSCHLSAEVLLPAVFYCMERMLRRPSVKSILLTGSIHLLAVVAGMPQSTFLILMYGYLYFLFRATTDGELRAAAFVHVKHLFVAALLGFGSSLFLLVPFVEFLSVSYDSHRPSSIGDIPGLRHSSDARYLLLDLLPLIAGPIGDNIFSAPGDRRFWLSGYSGVAAVVLAVLAALGLARSSKNGRSERLLILFFSLSVVAFILKIYGHPIVNWIGSLPIFNVVLYHKYLKPLLGFSIAILAAFGASRIHTERIGLRQAIAAPAAVAALVLFLAWSFRADLSSASEPDIFYAILRSALIGIIILSGAMAIARNPGLTVDRTRTKYAARWLIATIVTCELLLNYIYPMYYRHSRPASEKLDPYEGAPYINILQNRNDYYRVFAREGYLFPNWSSAFGLHDVRNLDGINWGRYLHFIRSFLASSDVKKYGELGDRFTGRGQGYSFSDWKEERFLQLSSVRYLISRTPLIDGDLSLVAEIVKRGKKRRPRPWRPGQPGYKGSPEPVRLLKMPIGGETRDVLAQPLSSIVRFTRKIPKSIPFLKFSPVLLNETYGEACQGVTFSLRIQTKGMKRHSIFSRVIDLEEKHLWLDETLDLRRYAGKRVTLFLRVVGEPVETQGFAGWGDLSLVGDRETEGDRPTTRFELIYDQEAKVFQYMGSLPRASIFHAAELVDNADAALSRLQDRELDIWRRAVVSTEDLDSDERRALEILARAEGERARAAEITFYDSQRVRIEAELERPGLLMLTDSNYPGWRVYVDGMPAALLEADYLFRGVLLPAGSHEVEFRYQPASYAYGAGLSILSLVLAGVLVVRKRKRARRARIENTVLE